MNPKDEIKVLQEEFLKINQELIEIRKEKTILSHRLALLRFPNFLIREIKHKFDPDLSRRIDAILFLLESFHSRRVQIKPPILSAPISPEDEDHGKKFCG